MEQAFLLLDTPGCTAVQAGHTWMYSRTGCFIIMFSDIVNANILRQGQD